MKLFISIEGVECVGKTIVSQQIITELQKFGIQTLLLPEFPKDVCYNLIENTLSKSIFISEEFKYGPRAAFFYMLFLQLVSLSRIKWDNNVVIADRYFDSIAVYQGAFLSNSLVSGKCLSYLHSIESIYKKMNIPIPDITFILKIPTEKIKERFYKKEKRNLSRDEQVRIEYFKNEYDIIAKTNKRYQIIDASTNVNQTTKRIMRFISQLLLNR